MPVISIRTVFAIVLVAHGLGHALGVFPVFGLRLSATHSAASTLLPPGTRVGTQRTLAIALWGAGLAAFIAAGLSLAGWVVPLAWWRTLLLVAPTVSFGAILVFWGGLPFFFPNKVGAIGVNLLSLTASTWLGPAPAGG